MSSLHALSAVARDQSGARSSSGDVVTVDRATAPQIVGRYALFDQIASGGMGVVHLGRLMGAAGFERVVAMKRTHRSLATDPEFVAMFCEEVRIISRIRHPNVVTALDVVDDEGELVLVMEYVHGEALGGLMRRARELGAPVPVNVAVSIACGVLRGLHAAHTASSAGGQPLDIVHRDVSPQNVLVGCDGVARVLDFGVAKARDSLAVTQVGQVKGRLSYMAPEQLRGGGIDQRVDIYGLSVVLWELLANRSLFPGRDTEVIEKVLLGTIPSLAELGREVSSELERVVLRGLASDPSQRFSTAQEMALALETHLQGSSLDENARWLSEVAGDTLEARARLVAHAETYALSGDAPTDVPAMTEAPSLPPPPAPAVVDWDDATVVDQTLPSDSVTQLLTLPVPVVEAPSEDTRLLPTETIERALPFVAPVPLLVPPAEPVASGAHRRPAYGWLAASGLVLALGAGFCWQMYAGAAGATVAAPKPVPAAVQLPAPEATPSAVPLLVTPAPAPVPAAQEAPAPQAAAKPRVVSSGARPIPSTRRAPRPAPSPAAKPVRPRHDSRWRSVDGF